MTTRGLLNLTHRESHEHPTPLEPGKRYTVTIPLNGIAYALPAGHRWRLAISPTYFPHAWPSPETVTLTLSIGKEGEESHLSLPVRQPRPEDSQLTPFEPPEHAPMLAHQTLRHATRKRSVQRDLITGLHQLIDEDDGGCTRLLTSGLEFDSQSTDTFSIIENEPLSASVECTRDIKLKRDDWQTRIETKSLMSADAENFLVSNQLDAYEGNTRIFTKNWSLTVPRDLV